MKNKTDIRPIDFSTGNNVVINVEELWKEYRLGTINHGTLAQDLNSWWAKLRGKEDPNQRIDSTIQQSNDSTSSRDRFWALKDVSFNVKQGEILGIIGKNGAGKSTLLKILSQVTTPTKGEVNIRGRMASLLEVGTGFHPELTGRENIFLNGAILGMSKQEINSKLEAIIDFSGVEKFIDTPVKRYSSGMYVRLAFAVAAHLEPEILIVDEVLAVGDAAFQKKCLGKMQEVSNEGRTVLFVSHNMGAIKSLCSEGVYLSNGKVSLIDTVDNVVGAYLSASEEAINVGLSERKDRSGRGNVRINDIKLNDKAGREVTYIPLGNGVRISLLLNNKYKESLPFRIALTMRTLEKNPLLSCDTELKGADLIIPGEENVRLICDIPSMPLNVGEYYLNVAIFKDGTTEDWIAPALKFQVTEERFDDHVKVMSQYPLLTQFEWMVDKI